MESETEKRSKARHLDQRRSDSFVTSLNTSFKEIERGGENDRDICSLISSLFLKAIELNDKKRKKARRSLSNRYSNVSNKNVQAETK